MPDESILSTHVYSANNQVLCAQLSLAQDFSTAYELKGNYGFCRAFRERRLTWIYPISLLVLHPVSFSAVSTNVDHIPLSLPFLFPFLTLSLWIPINFPWCFGHLPLPKPNCALCVPTWLPLYTHCWCGTSRTWDCPVSLRSHPHSALQERPDQSD